MITNDLSHDSVIVTGGAGFIGSAVIWALNRSGVDNILVVDRLDETEKWKNLVPLRFRDFLDADSFAARIERDEDSLPDAVAVIHLGACSSTTETDAAYLIRNNYEYTKRLAHWAVRKDVRFVYASSAATYGAEEESLSDEQDLDVLRPLNMYAYSKHLFDKYSLQTGLSTHIAGLKYFNVFGPNEQHKGDMRSLVDKAFHQIRKSGSVRLFRSHRAEYGDGEQCRDFVYVKDAVNMTLFVAQRDLCGIFNVGSGTAHTWLDLVHPIFDALELEPNIEFVDMPEHLRSKYQYYTCARMEKLRRAGYDAAMTPLHDAVTDYVRNYLLADQRLDPRAS